MKTIRAIKGTKDVELGEIRRVDDRTAHNTVGSLWQYISKSEWKLATRKSKTANQDEQKVNTKQDLPDNEGKEFVKKRKKSKS